jgi:hypothetical protein
MTLPFEDEPEYGERFIEADGDSGYIVIPVRDLPVGSVITVTIRIGPEPVEAPAPVGEVTPTPKRYMGGPRING